jgi:hypothetical protein
MGFNRSDIKVSFINDKTRFYVNEKKGTVVCVVEAVVKTPINWDSCILVPNTFLTERGTAKCAPGDTFDVERGKRIALARAENNAYLAALKYIDKYMADIAFIVNAHEEFTDKAYRACAHNEDYIQSLSYEAHPEYKKELKPLRTGE